MRFILIFCQIGYVDDSVFSTSAASCLCVIEASFVISHVLLGWISSA